MHKIQIFDTTLRDGEQSPGFSMNRDEKLKLAHQIEEIVAYTDSLNGQQIHPDLSDGGLLLGGCYRPIAC